jgi:hypothetical protein
MRRTVCAALISVAALAACNPSAPAGDVAQQAQDAASAVFPNLFQAAYRAEATITAPDGSTMPMVMIRDGRKVRMEMSLPQGQVISVMNEDAGEFFTINSAMGRRMVIRQRHDEMQNAPDIFWDDATVQTFTPVGPCSHIGESGMEWSRPRESGTQNSCVTEDGIILWSTDNGRTTWQTTSIQRGPQDASLFAMPAGVQVMDLGQMGSGMSEALEAAKAAAGQ